MQMTILYANCMHMNQKPALSIYLDKRRALKNGKYPVKIRVFQSIPRKQKLYKTVFVFTESEFKSIWLTIKPREKYRESREEIQAVEKFANDIVKDLDPFTFVQFEKRLFRKSGDGINVKYQYSEIIQELNDRKQVGTSGTYNLSQKSILNFCKSKKISFEKLTLKDISNPWLKDYEAFMLGLGKSTTTISIYLRALRAVFNKAISENEMGREYYPFGRRKYVIPAAQKRKKAYSKEQLSIFFQSKCENEKEQRAKDFWFLSYACNGMNIKDIALLKEADIYADYLEFIRAKTRITSKDKEKEIRVYLNEFSKSIIEKYKVNPIGYWFGIINENDDAFRRQAKIKNFTRYINQHVKKIAERNNLPELSTYTARHSYASIGIKNGATMAFMQEALGHENIETTQNYFNGFDDETKKEFAQTLMDFSKNTESKK